MDKKPLSKTQIIIVALVALAIIGYFAGVSEKKAPAKPQTRIEKFESNFDPWNGSLPQLVKIVKNNMNDEDSFDHIESRYIDNGKTFIVTMRFRGKNAFGGVVQNMVKAEVTLDGNVLKIIQ